MHRIASEAGRGEGFHPLSGPLLADPDRAARRTSSAGSTCRAPSPRPCCDAVEASDADVIAFYPYLYYPTIRGLPLVRERAILHPAAHEEPALHLPLFDALFAQCRGFAFHTRSERRLVVERFGVATTPQVVVGLGVEEADGHGRGRPAPRSGWATRRTCCASGGWTTRRGRESCGVTSAPTRSATPVTSASSWWGRSSTRPMTGRDIVVTGMIDDEAKWGLLRGAHALVAPSPFESFSLTVVEGMTAGAPVIVNAVCGATREHCEQSGAGMWFEGYAEFEAVLDRMLGDAALHETMRQNGLRYVEANYRWPVIMERYGAFLEAFVAPPLSGLAGGGGRASESAREERHAVAVEVRLLGQRQPAGGPSGLGGARWGSRPRARPRAGGPAARRDRSRRGRAGSSGSSRGRGRGRPAAGSGRRGRSRRPGTAA